MSFFTGHKNWCQAGDFMCAYNGIKMHVIYKVERKVETHLFTVAATAPSDQI